jgi:hemolysin activation/secretion protein
LARAVVTGVACLTALSSALAQTAPSPSRVTPRSLAPPKPDVSAAIALLGVATGAPPGADVLLVRLAGVEVEGGDPFATPAGAVDAIRKAKRQLSGRIARVSDIYAAAARIEAAYARAGYVLTRVTLPPQRIVDGGTVKLLIVDGFIESIDVSGVPARVRAAVRRRVAPLVGVRGLKLEQIERRVLLAGEAPGVQLRSTLVPGAAVGATRLVLEARDQPLSATLSADNEQAATYGYESISAQIAFNSMLGLGEQIYVQATNGPDLGHLFSGGPSRRILGAGVIVPVGDDGLTLNAEYTRADTHPNPAPGTLAVSGLYERLAFRATYPLIETRRQHLDVTGSFELTSETETADAFGVPLSEDRLRVASVALSYTAPLTPALSLTANGQAAFGIAGLGARTQDDAAASGVPLSRQGSRPDFDKVGGQLRFTDRFGAGYSLSSITIGQVSFNGALPSSAQISLDNGAGLSSFTQGDNSVDSGVVERVELARDLAFARPLGGMATPYLFGAAGYGRLYDPTVLEAPDIDAWSFGAGLRLQLTAPAARIAGFGSIELSRGHATTLAGSANRITASVTFRR